MAPQTVGGGPLAGPSAPKSPPWVPFESSGRRWFILGAALLVIMGAAVWAVHRDPVAISALFLAIAVILRTVPRIMEARARTLLYGAVCSGAVPARYLDGAALPHAAVPGSGIDAGARRVRRRRRKPGIRRAAG